MGRLQKQVEYALIGAGLRSIPIEIILIGLASQWVVLYAWGKITYSFERHKMPNYHLAQINIARMLAPIGDPIMAEL